MKTLQQRMEDKTIPVTESGCLLWVGATNPDGYGNITVGGVAKKAHRVAWELAFGAIPEGKCVMHKCDVPACIRADHLKLGTHSENMRDMIEKGRGNKATGDRHWVRKIGGRFGKDNSNYRHGRRCIGHH